MMLCDALHVIAGASNKMTCTTYMILYRETWLFHGASISTAILHFLSFKYHWPGWKISIWAVAFRQLAYSLHK